MVSTLDRLVATIMYNLFEMISEGKQRIALKLLRHECVAVDENMAAEALAITAGDCRVKEINFVCEADSFNYFIVTEECAATLQSMMLASGIDIEDLKRTLFVHPFSTKDNESAARNRVGPPYRAVQEWDLN